MAQIVALTADEEPPEGVQFVLVTIDAKGLKVISNAAEGTTFSAPNTEAALDEALERACIMADERDLIVYMRYVTSPPEGQNSSQLFEKARYS